MSSWSSAPAGPRLRAARGDRGRVGTALVAVAHDAIPVVSADMVPPRSRPSSCSTPPASSSLPVWRPCRGRRRRDVGFVTALRTQGLDGPLVTEVLARLAGGAHGDRRPAPSSGAPGRPGRRLARTAEEPPRGLHAAEVLWREGVMFSLTFIGGSGWGEEFPDRVAELQELAGRWSCAEASPTTTSPAAYRSAAFSVFPSLARGLRPAGGSRSRLAPRSSRPNFGATAETAFDGGAALIDPWDDGALTDAMRILLDRPRGVGATFEKRLAIALSETGRTTPPTCGRGLVEPEIDGSVVPRRWCTRPRRSAGRRTRLMATPRAGSRWEPVRRRRGRTLTRRGRRTCRAPAPRRDRSRCCGGPQRSSHRSTWTTS